jgi:hypothetical protein
MTVNPNVTSSELKALMSKGKDPLQRDTEHSPGWSASVRADHASDRRG